MMDSQHRPGRGASSPAMPVAGFLQAPFFYTAAPYEPQVFVPQSRSDPAALSNVILPSIRQCNLSPQVGSPKGWVRVHQGGKSVYNRFRNLASFPGAL